MGTSMAGFEYNDEPTEVGNKNTYTSPFEDPGIQDRPDADKTFAAATDPGTATQEALHKNGSSGRENLNEGSLKRAQSGEDYKNNMQYGSNIPVEGPFANYNNMSWDQTQRLSRLADAYNASHRWNPGKAGIDAAGTSVPQYTQQDAIQTEEMRRGDLTRQGLGQQQSLALNRADRILTHPQQLTEMLDQVGIQADQAQMEIMRNFADYVQRANVDENFKAVFEQALQKDMLKYTQELAYYEQSKVATAMYNLMSQDHEFASWLASNLTSSVVPTVQQTLANKVTQKIYSSRLAEGMDYKEVLAEVSRVISDITGGQALIDTQQNNYVQGMYARNMGRGWAGGGVTR